MKHLASLIILLSSHNIILGMNQQPDKATNTDTIEISEKCYENLNKIKKDVSTLKYYCEGVFLSLGEKNNPQYKPSDVITWLHEESQIDKNTQLQYLPASTYIKWFAQDKKDTFDTLFAEKYAETQNVGQTWRWFNDYFAEHALKQPASEYLENMVERDAKRVEFAKKGVFFSDDGRTITIIDPSRIKLSQ